MQDLTSSGLDVWAAEIKPRSIVFPKIQEELENIYLERLKWVRDVKKNLVHKKLCKLEKIALIGIAMIHLKLQQLALKNKHFF